MPPPARLHSGVHRVLPRCREASVGLTCALGSVIVLLTQTGPRCISFRCKITVSLAQGAVNDAEADVADPVFVRSTIEAPSRPALTSAQAPCTLPAPDLRSLSLPYPLPPRRSSPTIPRVIRATIPRRSPPCGDTCSTTYFFSPSSMPLSSTCRRVAFLRQRSWPPSAWFPFRIA